MPKIEVSRMYRYLVREERDMQFDLESFDGEDPFVLNSLGSQGWELIAVTPSRRYVFMKRDR